MSERELGVAISLQGKRSNDMMKGKAAEIPLLGLRLWFQRYVSRMDHCQG